MKASGVALTIVGAFFTTAGSTENQAMRAADLQELCQGSDTTSRNVCRIYILGVVQGIEVGLSIADGKGLAGRPCVPDDTSAEALQATIRKKLGEHLKSSPADRGRDASAIIGAVLVKTFPCAPKRP
jgi:Rap1a immunity proteins